MFLSVFHAHFAESVSDADQVVITKDYNECAVCASHFKVSNSVPNFKTEFFLPDFIDGESKESAEESPIAGIHNERAPPFFIRG